MNHIRRAIKSAVRTSCPLLVVCLMVLTSSLPLPSAVQAAAGDLDATFGIGGKVMTDFLGANDHAFDIAIQPDGKIIAAGDFLGSEDSNSALVRYDPNGNPDSSFGNAGKAFANELTSIFAIALQPDGKIVAAGSTTIDILTTGVDFALMRFNSDGSIDSSFGSGGMAATDFFGSFDEACGVGIQSDGKIIVVGVAFDDQKDNFALARYDSNGDPDAGFGNGGKIITRFGAMDERATAVAIGLNDSITGVGFARNSVTGQNDFAVARYDKDGNPDNAFSGDGKVTTGFAGGTAQASAVAIQPDGRIVVAGSFFGGGNIDFALARYNSNGSMDLSFGNNGKITTDFAGNFDNAEDVAIQPDGKLIAAGFTLDESTDISDFALARYNSNGSLDSGFGSGGRLTTDFFGDDDRAGALVIQLDRKIVAAGFATNSGTDFALVRYENDAVNFGFCAEDDSNDNLLQIDTTTGEYQMTDCRGFVIGGTGALTRKGCTITLQHNAADRRVVVKIDACQKKATASVQIFSQSTTFTITDRNTMNNTCACGN